MATFTKKAIKETFITMLEEHPLSDITVKDIVEKCEINRNSFYYHYQDIPALIEEIVKEEAEQILLKYPSVSTIVECFDALIECDTHRKRAIFTETLKSKDQMLWVQRMNAVRKTATEIVNNDNLRIRDARRRGEIPTAVLYL